MKKLSLLLVLTACSSVPTIYTRQPLADQRLAPRPGFKGLTNQVCMEKDPKTEACIKMDTLEYDLTSKEIRDRLIALKFICNVNGLRFRIDGVRPGLVSNQRKNFFGGVKEFEFIDVNTGYQRLLDANTVCASQNSILGQSLFLK